MENGAVDKAMESVRKQLEGKIPKLWEKCREFGIHRLIILFLSGVLLLLLCLPAGTLSHVFGQKGKSDSNASMDTGVVGAESDSVDYSSMAWRAMETYASQQEKQLQKILSHVDGVGTVDVMITLAASEEKVPLQNQNAKEDITKETDKQGGNRDNSSTSENTETVLIQGEEGEEPYVVQIQSPTVEGVVVVAQGADGGQIDGEIIQAVEALFPIEAHKIKVMKRQ